VRAVRAEYAEEEVEAAEVEAAQNSAALELSLSLRITRELDDALKRRSLEEQISPSALVRRLLRQALQRGGRDQLAMTERRVEEIAVAELLDVSRALVTASCDIQTVTKTVHRDREPPSTCTLVRLVAGAVAGRRAARPGMAR
jgi:hypothetical protein